MREMKTMKNSKAFIFDMDGTMFDNMQYHLQAWEQMVAELGSPLRGEELFKQLYGKNKEVIERIFGQDRFTEEEKNRISVRKDQYFRHLYGPHLKLMRGLNHFLQQSRDGNILLAIATGGLMDNIDFSLEKTGIRDFFSAIVSEADVTNSKPDPETFLLAAKQMGVSPDHCIVFEDVPKGVEAANRAGMNAVVILSSHEKTDFAGFPNVISLVKDYTALQPGEVFAKINKAGKPAL